MCHPGRGLTSSYNQNHSILLLATPTLNIKDLRATIAGHRPDVMFYGYLTARRSGILPNNGSEIPESAREKAESEDAGDADGEERLHVCVSGMGGKEGDWDGNQGEHEGTRVFSSGHQGMSSG
eukprot:scaffold53777_cov28-Tisochrysis_lutea.AAC.1